MDNEGHKLEWRKDMYEDLIKDLVYGRRTFTEHEWDVILVAIVDGRRHVDDMIMKDKLKKNYVGMMEVLYGANGNGR